MHFRKKQNDSTKQYQEQNYDSANCICDVHGKPLDIESIHELQTEIDGYRSVGRWEEVSRSYRELARLLLTEKIDRDSDVGILDRYVRLRVRASGQAASDEKHKELIDGINNNEYTFLAYLQVVQAEVEWRKRGNTSNALELLSPVLCRRSSMIIDAAAVAVDILLFPFISCLRETGNEVSKRNSRNGGNSTVNASSTDAFLAEFDHALKSNTHNDEATAQGSQHGTEARSNSADDQPIAENDLEADRDKTANYVSKHETDKIFQSSDVCAAVTQLVVSAIGDSSESDHNNYGESVVCPPGFLYTPDEEDDNDQANRERQKTEPTPSKHNTTLNMGLDKWWPRLRSNMQNSDFVRFSVFGDGEEDDSGLICLARVRAVILAMVQLCSLASDRLSREAMRSGTHDRLKSGSRFERAASRTLSDDRERDSVTSEEEARVGATTNASTNRKRGMLAKIRSRAVNMRGQFRSTVLSPSRNSSMVPNRATEIMSEASSFIEKLVVLASASFASLITAADSSSSDQHDCGKVMYTPHRLLMSVRLCSLMGIIAEALDLHFLAVVAYMGCWRQATDWAHQKYSMNNVENDMQAWHEGVHNYTKLLQLGPAHSAVVRGKDLIALTAFESTINWSSTVSGEWNEFQRSIFAFQSDYHGHGVATTENTSNDADTHEGVNRVDTSLFGTFNLQTTHIVRNMQHSVSDFKNGNGPEQTSYIMSAVPPLRLHGDVLSSVGNQCSATIVASLQFALRVYRSNGSPYAAMHIAMSMLNGTSQTSQPVISNGPLDCARIASVLSNTNKTTRTRSSSANIEAQNKKNPIRHGLWSHTSRVQRILVGRELWRAMNSLPSMISFPAQQALSWLQVEVHDVNIEKDNMARGNYDSEAAYKLSKSMFHHMSSRISVQDNSGNQYPHCLKLVQFGPVAIIYLLAGLSSYTHCDKVKTKNTILELGSTSCALETDPTNNIFTSTDQECSPIPSNTLIQRVRKIWQDYIFGSRQAEHNLDTSVSDSDITGSDLLTPAQIALCATDAFQMLLRVRSDVGEYYTAAALAEAFAQTTDPLVRSVLADDFMNENELGRVRFDLGFSGRGTTCDRMARAYEYAREAFRARAEPFLSTIQPIDTIQSINSLQPNKNSATKLQFCGLSLVDLCTSLSDEACDEHAHKLDSVDYGLNGMTITHRSSNNNNLLPMDIQDKVSLDQTQVSLDTNVCPHETDSQCSHSMHVSILNYRYSRTCDVISAVMPSYIFRSMLASACACKCVYSHISRPMAFLAVRTCFDTLLNSQSTITINMVTTSSLSQNHIFELAYTLQSFAIYCLRDAGVSSGEGPGGAVPEQMTTLSAKSYISRATLALIISASLRLKYDSRCDLSILKLLAQFINTSSIEENVPTLQALVLALLEDMQITCPTTQTSKHTVQEFCKKCPDLLSQLPSPLLYSLGIVALIQEDVNSASIIFSTIYLNLGCRSSASICAFALSATFRLRRRYTLDPCARKQESLRRGIERALRVVADGLKVYELNPLLLEAQSILLETAAASKCHLELPQTYEHLVGEGASSDNSSPDKLEIHVNSSVDSDKKDDPSSSSFDLYLSVALHTMQQAALAADRAAMNELYPDGLDRTVFSNSVNGVIRHRARMHTDELIPFSIARSNNETLSRQRKPSYVVARAVQLWCTLSRSLAGAGYLSHAMRALSNADELMEAFHASSALASTQSLCVHITVAAAIVHECSGDFFNAERTYRHAIALSSSQAIQARLRSIGLMLRRITLAQIEESYSASFSGPKMSHYTTERYESNTATFQTTTKKSSTMENTSTGLSSESLRTISTQIVDSVLPQLDSIMQQSSHNWIPYLLQGAAYMLRGETIAAQPTLYQALKIHDQYSLLGFGGEVCLPYFAVPNNKTDSDMDDVNSLHDTTAISHNSSNYSDLIEELNATESKIWSSSSAGWHALSGKTLAGMLPLYV